MSGTDEFNGDLLATRDVDVPYVKNNNQKFIFSLFQCFDSTNSYCRS